MPELTETLNDGQQRVQAALDQVLPDPALTP